VICRAAGHSARLTNIATICKLDALAEELAPDQPWPAIRGIGNRLRHEYDVVDKGELWRIFTSDLQSLRIACNAAIERLHDRTNDPDPELR
jgi:uncharacterized protein with HEPN domain